MTDSSATEGIKTVLHPVSDLAAAKPVYAALLGVQPSADASYYVGFDAAGQHIGLVPGGGGMTSPVAYWHVPDIEAKLAEVTAAGAKREGPGARRGWRPPGGHRHRPRRQRPRAAPGLDEHGHESADAQSPALHAADSHELIRVHGARVNNLKDVSVEIPKRRLTVFTGVSGSGKSSLVFGTIAAESQRLINETYSAFVQGFMPTLARPEVDVLEGLTTAIIVDQERMGADPRSTVGTATDANAMLRILFSRLGQPHIGSPKAFSFNVAVDQRGGCGHLRARRARPSRSAALQHHRRHVPALRGPGHRHRHRPGPALRRQQVAQRGRDHRPRLHRGRLELPALPRVGLLRPGQADPQVHQEGAARLPAPRAGPDEDRGHQHDLRGADPADPEVDAVQGQGGDAAAHPGVRGPRGHVHHVPGLRRHPAQRGWPGRRRSRASTSPTRARCRSATWPSGCDGLDEPSAAPLLAALQQTLDSFVEIGLGYLSLDRPSGTLSGGEAQRVKMIRQLGSSLTDVTYVFDEPTIGLHPHDIQRMNDLLLQLRDKGNTVLVVEHKPEAIAIADHVVDLGPGAGTAGGEVVFEGTVDGLRASGTLTGRHLDDRAALKASVRAPSGALEVRGASTAQPAGRRRRHPARRAGGGDRRGRVGQELADPGSVSGRDGVVSVDQAAIRGSRRSNPATYTGLLDPIRKAFAKANGVKPALFSANSEGACPNCNGAGVVYTDLAMMAGVATTCEECEGKRFEASVLDYHLGGRDISEVLAMPVAEAQEFFGAGEARTPAAHKILDRLADVGLGYVSLGQPLTTLSGGERQRLKLATHLAEKGGVYVLDEPTSGLHLADVEQLLGLLDRLVDSGKSVIVIEHHQAVMAHADWIIDLGPGAGHDGGRIVFEGTPGRPGRQPAPP